jgi:sugar phosphate isomerase/epimerase
MPLADLDCEWIMWSGTIGRQDLATRMAATRAAGYAQMSVYIDEVVAWAAAGVDLRSIRATADGAGVRLTVLDAVAGWTESDAVAWPSASFPVGAALDAAALLGATSVSAIAMVDSGPDLRKTTLDFAQLCDQAVDRGIGVNLEFVPMLAVKDLAATTRLLEEVDRPNAGMIFDTWHFHRTASRIEDIARAARFVNQIQVSDAGPATDDLIRETYLGRRLPGDGEMPLPVILRALHDAGAIRSIGPEILSSEVHRLGPEGAARAGAEALDRALRLALA